MMLRCGLVAADLLTNAHGPTYTFRKKSHSSVSYLDHCLVSQELLPNVSSCYVIDDNFENFSDHLPISIHLKLSTVLTIQETPVLPELHGGDLQMMKSGQNIQFLSYTK